MTHIMLFGGKGGVGKTSCAAATALHAATKGKKTLILSTDPAHSLGDSFKIEIGNKITRIVNNLNALEIDASSLFKDYMSRHDPILKQILDEGTFFNKEDIQKFLDLAMPGMDEMMALFKIVDILEENRYDLIILDTAPTGHTIRLLEMPDLMMSYIKVLAEMRQKHRVIVSITAGKYIKDGADKFIDKMYNDVERIKITLKSDKTEFIPIITPEAMSIYETERLMNTLEKHKIPVKKILINRVIDKNCGFCESRRVNQRTYLKEIKKKFFRYEIKEIPLFANEIRGKSLDNLAKLLSGEGHKLPEPVIKQVADPIFSLLNLKPTLKFLLFGGKGGVGKTTCSAATALHESKNKKVFLLSTDPAHSLSDSFDVEIGNKITKINDNLDALEIDSYVLWNELRTKYKKEIRDFFSSVFKSTKKTIIDAPYDRKVMEDLFDLSPPGLDEIMALKAMMDLVEGNKYDLFILDTAPTGHTIRLLETPEIAEKWINTLLSIQEHYPVSYETSSMLTEMLDTIKKLRTILTNSNETEFIVITIPEAMGLLETQDLINALNRLNITVKYIVINKIIPRSICSFCTAKRAEQIGYIKNIQEISLETIGIELFEKEIRGSELNKITDVLFNTPDKSGAITPV